MNKPWFHPWHSLQPLTNKVLRHQIKQSICHKNMRLGTLRKNANVTKKWLSAHGRYRRAEQRELARFEDIVIAYYKRNPETQT